MEQLIKDEHRNWLEAKCVTLCYSRPCLTAACLKRAKLQGMKKGKATCIPLELYNLLCDDKENDLA